MNRSEMQERIRRLRNTVGYKRRRGENYDAEARELAALLAQCDEISQIRGVKMSPIQKINSIRG